MAKTVKKTSTTATGKTSAAAKKTDVSAKKTAAANQESATVKKAVKRDLSNVNPDLTDAFIQEVDEDVKNDNLKVFWNRYGMLIVAFVVLAVSAAISFDQIQAWKTAQNQKRTHNYMTAAQTQEKPEDTLAALQKISQDNQGIFSDFARLQIANVLFSEEKNEEAMASLEQIVNDKQANTEVRHIALVKLATYKVDTLGKEEFAALIKPLIDANNSWTPVAQDLLAMSAIKHGDIETAKKIYENILTVKDLPEGFKSKIQDILSSISDM